ncbi:MAG: energy-coupled thiamine transporter ThiT [Clostridia bacterium]|nr:energy-coupled thiamine transporter ThiT [Clostridia bacterium]
MLVNSLLATYAFDTAESVILWLTVGVLAALIVAGVVIYFAKRSIAGAYAKYAVLGFVGYALVAGITMLALQLSKRTNPAYLEDKWLNADVVNYVLVPLLVVFSYALICGVVLFVISKKKPIFLKPLAITFGAHCGAGIIAAGVTIGIYFTRHIVDDGYYSDYTNQLALYLSAAALIVILVVGALVLGYRDKKSFDSRSIALAGICIAMSFVLSYVKLWDMPFGGSITLVSLFPVMLYAYTYGTKKGLLIGFIYGLMQAMQDPYIIHPAQFLLDYPIAFAFVAFAGAFKNIGALKFPQVKFALGAIMAGSLRFVAHLFSGVFAFGANAAAEGFDNFWLYSATYNSYVFVDIALVVVAGVLVLSSKAFIKQLESYAADKKKEEPKPEEN